VTAVASWESGEATKDEGGLLATHGVSSLELNEDDTSKGSQRWRTRAGGLTTSHSSNLAILGEDGRKQGDVQGRSFFFFFWLCAPLC